MKTTTFNGPNGSIWTIYDHPHNESSYGSLQSARFEILDFSKLPDEDESTLVGREYGLTSKVFKADLLKAEDLYHQGKLHKVTFPNEQYPEHYVEIIEGEEIKVSIWPTVFGYEGCRDGWVCYANSYENLAVEMLRLGAKINTRK